MAARKYCTFAPRTCPWCEVRFSALRPDKMFCTEPCKRLHWRSRNPERVAVFRARSSLVEAAKRASKPREREPKPKSTSIHRCGCGRYIWLRRKKCLPCASAPQVCVVPCKKCGKSFERITGSSARFCSAQCRSTVLDATKKAGRANARLKHGKDTHRKRAKRYGVKYEQVWRSKVFERDGWNCQICGKPTRRDKVKSHDHPLAPTLDHRVPFALGGNHTYENVQCAHRQCNASKGARHATGQLPLFSI